MTANSIRTLVRAYYSAWSNQNRNEARKCLGDAFDFRSPQDRFSQADEFLDACWKYSEGITGVTFLKEVYSDTEAFVILKWSYANQSSFVGAEYLRINAGHISQILVVNNDASLGKLMS